VQVTIYNASKRVYGDPSDPKTTGQVVVEFYEGLTPIDYPTRTVVLPLQPIKPGEQFVYPLRVRAGVSPHFYRVPFRVSLRLRERLIEFSDRNVRITPDWYVHTRIFFDFWKMLGSSVNPFYLIKFHLLTRINTNIIYRNEYIDAPREGITMFTGPHISLEEYNSWVKLFQYLSLPFTIWDIERYAVGSSLYSFLCNFSELVQRFRSVTK